MDLTRPVSFRGLFLNGASGGPGGNQPIDGQRLTRVNFSDVPAVGYTEKKALEDGLDASDVFLGGRTITLQGEVFQNTKAALFDMLDVLRLKFTATDCYAESPGTRGYLPLSFEVPTALLAYWPTGFIEREIWVRPLTQPQYDIELAAVSGVEDNGYVLPYVARLQAKDPRFYHPTAVDAFLSGGGGSGALVNRGSYPSPLTVVIRPDSAAAGTFHLSGLGTSMDVTIPAGSVGRFVFIDSLNKICVLVMDAVETLRMDLPTFQSGTTWPRVPPTPLGQSAAFDWTSSVGLTSPSRLTFSEAWV
jgi:hypothetical protein